MAASMSGALAPPSHEGGPIAVLDLDHCDNKSLGDRNSNYGSDGSNVAAVNYGFTEVDEFSERKTISNDPLYPCDVIEDRSEIKPIAYQSKGFFLFCLASDKDKLLMLLGTICSMASGLSCMLHLQIFGHVVDVFTHTSNSTDVFALVGDESILYVILSFCTFILSAVGMYLWGSVKAKHMFRLRQVLLQSLFNKDIEWFDKNKGTEEKSLEQFRDLEVFERGIGETFALSIQWGSAVLTLMINALLQSPNVAGVIFLYFPCLIFASIGSFWLIFHYTRREQESNDQVEKALVKTIDNLRLISIYQSQEIESKRLFKKISFARLMTFRKYLCLGIKHGSFWMLAFLTLSTGGWYGSYLILNQRATPGKTIQTILGVLMSGIFVGQFYPCLEFIVKAREAAKNLMKVFNQNPIINRNLKIGRDLPILDLNMEFFDVVFCYPSLPDKKVLNNFSLSIQSNKTLAIVGPTGSGKSSILQLILRFYDPKKGQILINGLNLKEIKLQNLRRHIGFVDGKSSLMNCSLADNIRLGHESVTVDQVVNAAVMANAHQFIMELPKGYNSVDGEDGVELKDDEKIRICLARALIRNPRILLLDEVTSNLDNEQSENIVMEAIKNAAVGRMTVITSHKLSLIQNADTIVAIKDGQVMEEGTHQELMEFGGLYYELWSVQSCMAFGKMSDYNFEIELDNRRKKGISNGSKWVAVYSHCKSERDPDLEPDEENRLRDQQENNTQEEVSSLSFSKMKRLLKQNFPDWSYVVLASVSSILVGLIGPLFAIEIANFIYVFSISDPDEQYTTRRNAAARGMVVGVFLAPLNYLTKFFLSQIESKLTLCLRDATFKNLLKKEMSYFNGPEHKRKRLIKLFIRDAIDINGATALKLCLVLQFVSNLLGCVVVCFVNSWQLAFPLLGIFLPALVVLNYFNAKFYTWERNKRKTNNIQIQLNQMALEAFSHIRTVAILVKEDHIFRKCRSLLHMIYQKQARESIKVAILFGLHEGLVYCAFALGFAIGAYLVQNKMTDFTSVCRVLGTVVISSLMMGRICWNSPDYRKGRIAAERLLPLIEDYSEEKEEKEETKKKKKKSLEQCQGAVSFENVSFQDPTHPGLSILVNFSLHIPAGQTVAIVGAKDSEKKAIVDLLERLYKPTSGIIKLDHTGVEGQDLDWYRSQMTVLKLEVLFPEFSLQDNILYGCTSGMEQVIETCKLINIHDFIISLPKGYKTKLGEVFLPFHAQRLVIARALLRDAQIVIIHTESLALDLPSEKELQSALFERALVGKTLIFFADRLSMVENVSRIVVIDRGHVAQVGSHDDLMEDQHGLYYRLVQCQKNLKKRV